MSRSKVAELERVRLECHVRELKGFVATNSQQFTPRPSTPNVLVLPGTDAATCVKYHDIEGRCYCVPQSNLNLTKELDQLLLLSQEVMRMRVVEFFELVGALDSERAEALRVMWSIGGVERLRTALTTDRQRAMDLLRLLR